MSIVVGPRPYGQAGLAFVGGLGRANREAKLANRQQQAAFQAQLGQSIGQAVGDIGSAPFQAEIYKKKMGLEEATRNRLAAADDARQLASNLIYSKNRHEQALAEYGYEHTGTTPESLMSQAVSEGQYSPSQQAFMATPPAAGDYSWLDQIAAPSSGMQIVGPNGPIGPSPFSPESRYANPPAGYEYVDTKEGLMQKANYDAAMQQLESSTRYTPEEKIRGMQVLARKAGEIRKVLQPKSPVPMIPGPNGMMQPMVPGFNEAPSQAGIILDMDGNMHPYTPPSKGAPVGYAEMSPIEQRAYRIGAVGGEEEYQALVARGGMVLVDPSTGKPTVHEPKAATEPKPALTYDKAFNLAIKALTKKSLMGEEPPKPDAAHKLAVELMQKAQSATPGTPESKNAQVEQDKATMRALLLKTKPTPADVAIAAEIEARNAGR